MIHHPRRRYDPSFRERLPLSKGLTCTVPLWSTVPLMARLCEQDIDFSGYAINHEGMLAGS